MGKGQSLSRGLRVILFVLLTLTCFQGAHAQAILQPKLKPLVIVHDQSIVDGQITVAEVVAPQDGWIVIRRSQTDNLDSVIGLALVRTGMNTNVIVKLNLGLVTETLYTMLHIDAGQRGVYEFPGADAPIIVSNPPMLAFQITGLPSKPVAQVDDATSPVQLAAGSASAEPTLRTNEPVWLTRNATEAQLTGQGAPGGVLEVWGDDTSVSTTTIGATGTWTVSFPLDRRFAYTIAAQSVEATAPVSTVQAQITGQPFDLYLPLVAHNLTLQGHVTQAANLRVGPGLTFPIVGRARARQTITLVACNETCAWYQLANGTWIAAFLVQGMTTAPTTLPHLTVP